MTFERRSRLLRMGVFSLAIAAIGAVGVEVRFLTPNPPALATEAGDAPLAVAPVVPTAVPNAQTAAVIVAAPRSSATAATDLASAGSKGAEVKTTEAAADAEAKAPEAKAAEAKAAEVAGAEEAADSGAADYGTSLLDETYSATSNLTANIVTPAADYAGNPNAPIVVSTIEGAGVELAIGDVVISHRNLGKRSVDHKKHVTTYEYFGLHLKAGANAIRVTSLGKDGMRGEPLDRIVYVGGPAVRISAGLSGNVKLRADGRTRVPFVVSATDEWKHPVADGTLVRVTVAAGDAGFVPIAPPTREKDPAQAIPGASPTPAGVTQQVTLEMQGGKAVALLVPGLVAGDIVVQSRSGAVTDEETYFVSPFLRKAFVNGIVTAGAGSVPGNVDGDGSPDNGGSRRARIALYGTGKVANDTTATFAYETQNRLAPSSAYGPFTENPNERPYQSFGDQSSRRDDAVSQDRLYGRIEHNRDSLTYGRLNVATGSSAVQNGYAQQVNGLRLDAASGDGHNKLMVFQSRNDLAFAREIFNATGLATIGQVAHGNIVIGSDAVSVIAFDRRTGAVFAQTPLSPNVDYTLDSTSGQLHFITVPAPFDANLNPQVVLVTYQYYGQARDAKTLGGRGELGFGKAGSLRLGLGYINDSSGAGNFGLLNTDLSGRLPGGGFAFGYTQSSGISPANSAIGFSPTGQGGATGLALSGTSGRAFQAKIKTRMMGSEVDFGYDSTTIGFQNPFGGFSTPGFTDLHGSLRRSFGQGAQLALQYSAQKNVGYGSTSTQSELGAIATKAFGKTFALHAGLDFRASGGTLAPIPLATAVPIPGVVASALPVAFSPGLSNGGNVTQLSVGATWQARPGVQFGLERVADIGGTPSLTSPSLTTASITASLSKSIKGYLRESWTSTPYVSFADATSAYTIPVSGTRTTSVGLTEALGPNLSADQELSLNHTASGSDVLLSQGMREHIALGKHFSGDLGFQTSRGTQSVLQTALATTGQPQGFGAASTASGFNAYNFAFGYANDNNFRIAGGYQFRTGAGNGSTLTLGAGGPIGTEVGLLSSLQEAHGTGINSTDGRVGLSYRPTQNDRGVTLLEYEVHTGVTYGSTRANVVSIEELYRPTSRLEIAGRYAYKLDGNSDYAAHTSLFGARATQRIGSAFDLGTEARFLNAPGISGAAQTSFAVEGGIRILDRMRLGFGYNFQGAADPRLIGAPTRRGIYATMTSVVDRIFGWGSPNH